MTLAVGDLSLDAIARAEAWLAVPGGAEGFAAGTRGRCLYVAGMTWDARMTQRAAPKNRDSHRSGPVPDHPVARGRAGAFRGGVVSARGAERARPLADALGCALAEDVVAPIDVPPFDRSNVDGFAVRSADLASAGEATPVRVMLNDEVIACGTAPVRPVLSGTATSIATGGPVPRGADAIVMVEHTQPAGPRAIEIRRAASPGQFVSYAGSDIARGEALLRAGTIIGSREIGMLAACGIARGRRGAPAARRHHLHRRRTGAAGLAAAPGRDLRHQRRHRHRGHHARTAARRCFSAPFPTTKSSSKPRCARRCKTSDMLVLSGGTSKGAGDVSHRIIAPARPTRHHRAWRGAETGQAAVSCGMRRQAGGDPAGISDLGDVHLPRHDRAGAAPHGRPAAAFGRQGQRQSAGADRLRTRPHRIRDGVAGRGRGRL